VTDALFKIKYLYVRLSLPAWRRQVKTFII
jgi:hypothetical protein